LEDPAPKGIHAASVTRWLGEHVADVAPPLCFSLIAGGHSNLTYEIVDAARGRYVLRRPPLGAVLATAHDMAREHRIISALGPTPVPVAPALGLCEDSAVNEAPFYVMRFVEGEVLDRAERVERYVPTEERRALGEHMIEVLASLHRVDPDRVGLGDLGRKEAYVERQLKRFATQLEKSKTREIPIMDEVLGRLRLRIPMQQRATIVHGDYRLGNMIVSDARVAAVLDWELCTLGDPLADLGYLMNDWAPPEEGGSSVDGRVNPTVAGGFPSREEMIAGYAWATGLDVSELVYYRAFQSWRLAVIAEGVRTRYLKGVMGADADTDVLAHAVQALGERARDLLAKRS
jgi:aminoglycoside phosphotransferase (APT) family kinase protein